MYVCVCVYIQTIIFSFQNYYINACVIGFADVDGDVMVCIKGNPALDLYISSCINFDFQRSGFNFEGECTTSLSLSLSLLILCTSFFLGYV